MSMSKKDFIALANYVRNMNERAGEGIDHTDPYTEIQLNHLADFCAAQNPRFKRKRWFAYIAGECGPNGGKVKVAR